MKYLLLPLIALCVACNIDETEITPAVNANFTNIIEYTPAPGQFINDTQAAGFGGETSPQAACAYAERRLRNGDYVSLGGWGGTLVARFDTPIQNDNGYNLLIEGNTTSTSSEAGIVWVQRDENGNGLPDQTWYELRGSESAQSIRNYEVTYQRPAAAGDAVTWSDNQGDHGTMDRTPEHPQAYYPAWIKADKLVFRGTRLHDNVIFIDNLWIAQPFAWGYVDNFATEGRNLFRISDAVDNTGATVVLPQIDFVKIQTAIHTQAPLIGEISTEVTAIRNYNLLK
ncbi:MAG: hypothetical protein RSB29_01255 [Alistipes sp.]